MHYIWRSHGGMSQSDWIVVVVSILVHSQPVFLGWQLQMLPKRPFYHVYERLRCFLQFKAPHIGTNQTASHGFTDEAFSSVNLQLLYK